MNRLHRLGLLVSVAVLLGIATLAVMYSGERKPVPRLIAWVNFGLAGAAVWCALVVEGEGR